MDVMDMVRWILDPEWVLDITRYMMNVVVMVWWTLGLERMLVITIKFIGTPFYVVTSLSFSFFILDMGYLSLFFSCLRHFFAHDLSIVFSYLFSFFFHSPCLFFSTRLLEREREVTQHMELYFYGMDQ
jgi:hypothetical protein